MIELLVLVVAGVMIYALSRASGGRLGIMHILAILVGAVFLLGGSGVAVCGGVVAVAADGASKGLGVMFLAIGGLILAAGVWIVRATWRNAKQQAPPVDSQPR